MNRASKGFSQRSNGVLKGSIGAHNGWLVKIRQPNQYIDGTTIHVTFYYRKGFYTLNVQYIVDNHNKVL